MEVEITKDNNNAVIGRREIEVSIIQDDRTPSRDEVKKEVCKKLNLSPDSTIVVNLGQMYGLRQCTALLHSYPNSDSMKKFEHSYLFERHEKREKKAAAKAAGGEAPAPKEEKKEKKRKKPRKRRSNRVILWQMRKRRRKRRSRPTSQGRCAPSAEAGWRSTATGTHAANADTQNSRRLPRNEGYCSWQ